MSEVFRQQLKMLIAERGGLRAFASFCHLPHTTVRNWTAGDSLPNLEALITLSTTLEVNLDWLVFGSGPRQKGQSAATHPPNPGGISAGPPYPEALERLIRHLDLAKHAVLSERGARIAAFRIIATLCASYPEGISFSTLQRKLTASGLDLSDDRLMGDLLLLAEEGLILQSGDDLWRASESTVEIEPNSIADWSVLLIEAIDLLVNRIVPAARKPTPDGTVFVGEWLFPLTSARGQVESIMKTLRGIDPVLVPGEELARVTFLFAAASEDNFRST